MFHYVISNWLSLSYQTNGNIDLIPTVNQNDSTRLKNISPGILIMWLNQLEKSRLGWLERMYENIICLHPQGAFVVKLFHQWFTNSHTKLECLLD
jgi:hypothetical protein